MVFDSAARLPFRLQRRLDAWRRDPPHSQFQAYGPLNAYLQGHKFPSTHFLVKPQALLRGEAAEEAANRSIDSQGAGVTNEKNYPDFTICQYWGADNDSNSQADIIRVIIEVGYNQVESKRQLLDYLDLAGERWRGKILGVAVYENKVLLFKNVRPDQVAENKGSKFRVVNRRKGGWMSLFNERFVDELNSIHDYSIDNDATAHA